MCGSLPLSSPVKSTIFSCLSPDGSFNSDKYMQYAVAHASPACFSILMLMNNIPSHSAFHDPAVHQPVDRAITPVKIRSKKCIIACKGMLKTEDGPLEVITPKELAWYWYYVVNVLLYVPITTMVNKFRNSFRLPHPIFLEIAELIKADGRFD